MPDFTHCRIDRHIATVTLARPEVHNAFNEDIIEQLTGCFKELGANGDVRVVVLAGEGKNFCAGADINWMKKMVGYSFDENLEDTASLARMLRTIRDCPKPVIARVHGVAIGGGVGLVAACDMAAATADAKFGLTEVRLGIIPAVISPFVLDKIGSAMQRYALTAERFDASEAKRIGLISEVVEHQEQLDQWIAEAARAILRNGPQALAACKQVLREVRGVNLDTAEFITVRRTAERRVSEEGQDGLNAFLEKRPPGWVSEGQQ